MHNIITAFFILLKSIAISITWIAVSLLGLLFLLNRIPPWDFFVGLPLLLIAGGIVVNCLTSVVLANFIPYYNRGVCVLCGEEIFKIIKK